MSLVEYGTMAEDHCSLLVLVVHLGGSMPTATPALVGPGGGGFTTNQLKLKTFNRIYERISHVRTINISSNSASKTLRIVRLRYRRDYAVENNEWGDFQFHRRVLGLISIGRCEPAGRGETDNNIASIDSLCEAHEKLKERYGGTLLDSRLLLFTDIQTSTANHILPFPQVDLTSTSNHVPLCHSITSTNITADQNLIRDPLNALDVAEDSNLTNEDETDAPLRFIVTPENLSVLSAGPLRAIQDASLRRIQSEGKLAVPGLAAKSGLITTSSANSSPSRSRRNGVKDMTVKGAGEQIGGLTAQMRGDVWLYQADEDPGNDLEGRLHEFFGSLFWVLESKRLDRSLEKSEHPTFLAAPFEKRDPSVLSGSGSSADLLDNRPYKKRCQGRLRKQLGDLCLLAGVINEAVVHYQTALDLLKSTADRDALWIAGAYEGLAVTSYMLLQSDTLNNSLPVQTSSLQRNISFSVKRGTAGATSAVHQGKGTVTGSSGSGGQTLGLDLADGRGLMAMSSNATIASLPEDVLTSYKDAVFNYSRCREAATVEMEASLKACRVFIRHRRILNAAEFLQNIVYINAVLSEDEKVQRFVALASLYGQLGMNRKSAFYHRIAAMQCVSASNPTKSWQQCYRFLLTALPGYRLGVDPKLITDWGGPPGWSSVQLRVLHELVYSTRLMSNAAVTIRHLCYLLHVMFPYLSDAERLDLTSLLKTYTSKLDRRDGTALSIALDDNTILPPVPLTRFPEVRSFRLLGLVPHLRPMRFRCDTNSSVAPSMLLDTSPFIYSPLQAASTPRSKVEIAEQIDWVEGEVCEVLLHLVNPLPFELDVVSLTLLAEGVNISCTPASLTLPADCITVPLRLLLTPRHVGSLRVNGYVTEVMGLRNHCRLRDQSHLASVSCVASVIPPIPTLQTLTSLPPSESFCTLPDADCVVTSGYVSVYAGETSEFQLTLSNIGKLPVERIDILVSSSLSPSLRDSLIKWSEVQLQEQLPLSPGATATLAVTIKGISDFLTASTRHRLMKTKNLAVTDWTQYIYDHTDQSASGGGLISLELLLLVQYSGGQALAEGFCRQSAISLCVEVSNVVQISDWSIEADDGMPYCQLMLNICNVSNRDLDLLSAVEPTSVVDNSVVCMAGGKKVAEGTELLNETEFRVLKRLTAGKCDVVSLTLPRLASESLSDITLNTTTNTSDNRLEPTCLLAQYVRSVVKLLWSMLLDPLSSSSSLQPVRNGQIYLDSLSFTNRDCIHLQSSPITWSVVINGESTSPQSQSIQNFTMSLQCEDTVSVSVSLENQFGVALSDISLVVEARQTTSNASVCRATYTNGAFTDSVLCIGGNSVHVDCLSTGDRLTHSCMFVFPWPGIFQLLCLCTAGSISQQQFQAKPCEKLQTQWCHTVVFNLSDSAITNL